MNKQYLLLLTVVFLALFTTCKKNKPVTLTIMGETTVSDITSSTAVLNGNVLEVGENMEAYGHVWGETENPDISNYKSEYTKAEAGAFTDNFFDLKSDTKYYVRTYAKDGDEIVYKDALFFTTLPNVLAVETSEVTSISFETAGCGGNVINEGESAVNVKGVCWSTSENPTTGDFKTQDGTGTGAYTSELTGLSDNTTYYVRAYATNTEETVYGEQKSFSTNEYLTATVTTDDVTDVNALTAVCGGNVTSSGSHNVTARGVCWSTSENPTITDSKTEDGTGAGEFISNMSNMDPSTTYYVRAYATNEVGTAYGTQKTFMTGTPRYVGEYYQGGVIFYVDNTFSHGLICAVSDLSTGMSWHIVTDEYCGANLTSIGDGITNTVTIAEHPTITGGSAAKLCYDLTLNGYSDWFLPSSGELSSIYFNRSEINTTSLANGGAALTTGNYWSSTEFDLGKAVYLMFLNGISENGEKSNTNRVRAVRAF